MESISRHRREKSKETLNRQERDGDVFSRHRSQLRERTVNHLQDRLQARRKERERLQSESQVRKGGKAARKSQADGTTETSQPITSTLLHC
jgi:hypothetical protein